MSQARRLVFSDAEVRRSAVQARLADMTKIQFMGRRNLLKLQTALGFGSTWGVIAIPPQFMPAGSFQKTSRRITDFREVTNGNDLALIAITRVTLLRWLVPIGNTTAPCTASTLSENLSCLRRLAAVAMAKPAEGSKRFWARLSLADLYKVVPRTGKRDFARIFETLQRRKLLTDVVRMPIRRDRIEVEKVRKGREALRSDIKLVQPYLALPDKFVGECGWRCLWLINTLAPVLLSALEHLYTTVNYRAHITRHAAMKHFGPASSEFLSAWKWFADDSQRALEPPFELRLKSQYKAGFNGKRSPLSWPPKALNDCWRLISLIQDAHVFVVGVSGGPREGEILGQTQDALVEDPSGWRIKGKTYKLIFREDGEQRDWPAPKMTVVAVLQQVKLAQLAQQASKSYGFANNGRNLWVQMPTQKQQIVGLPLNGLGGGLKRLVAAFDLQHLLPDDSIRERNVHPHRMRKTTGRIVGLALTNAVQVLMDLFGHKDPEMTVGYLLSNRDIAEEAKAVAQAQTIMFAAEAISHVDGLGGPAAETLKSDVLTFARLRGLTKLDAKSIDELARDRTEGGLYWELVRPGVICTKLPGQVGVCNSKQGAPDPTHCRSNCDHRLEMAAEKANVDRTVARIITHLQNAIADDEPMAEQQWRGQLVAHILRFKDVLAKWETHPLVVEELVRINAKKGSS